MKLTTDARVARHQGLDALRGIAIAAMILVNNPGRWGEAYQFAPLRHAAWHGCTCTDLVFPTFLFCAGAAIVPALGRQLAIGTSRRTMLRAIGLRAVVLVLLGWLLSAFPLVTFASGQPLFAPLLHLRIPGVLQRIGVCYAGAALAFLYLSSRQQWLLVAGLLLGSWGLLAATSMGEAAAFSFSDPARTLQGCIDRALFGEHIWLKGQYDPEGLLSTLPALATCMLGTAAGRLLLAGRQRALLGLACCLLGIGWLWSMLLPFNKPLWTSSYALWTAGLATVGLVACTWLFEQRGWRFGAVFLTTYGRNALLVFVGSGLLGRVLGKLWLVGEPAQPAKDWFFAHALLPYLPAPWASLLFALLWVFGWYGLLAWCKRRGWYWRV